MKDLSWFCNQGRTMEGYQMNDVCAVTAESDRLRRQYRKAAARRPVCSICGEAIFADRAYRVDGNWVCPDCMEECKEYIWED